MLSSVFSQSASLRACLDPVAAEVRRRTKRCTWCMRPPPDLGGYSHGARVVLFFKHALRRFVGLVALSLISSDPRGASTPPSGTSGFPEQFVIKNWKTDHGLPQNWVECICQTRDGYLWLATRAGLARFDGLRFTVYNQATHPDLGLEAVKTLAEDSTGNLWIGTKTGLVRFHRDRFTRFAAADGLGGNEVIKVVLSPEDKIWIATGAGVTLFSNGVFHNYVNRAVEHKQAYCLQQRATGKILAGFTMGLFELDPADGKFREIWAPPAENTDPLKQDPVKAVYEDPSGTIWIGTYRGQLYRLGAPKKSLLPQGPGPERGIRQIYADPLGTLSVLTESELFQFQNGQFEALGLPGLFPDDVFLSAIRDAEGSVWLGTAYGGLNRLRPRVLQVYTRKDGLSHNDVWSVSESRGGRLWVGTSGGVSRFNGEKFEPWKEISDDPPQSVRSVLEDTAGGLWVGTAFVRTRHTQLIDGEWLLMPLGHVPLQTRVIYEDRDGDIWIGGRGGFGVMFPEPAPAWITRKGGKVLTTHAEQWLYTPEEVVRVLGEEHWIWRAGLWQHHATNELFHNSEHVCPSRTLSPEEVNQLPWCRRRLEGRLSNYDVHAILQDQTGTLWFGTGGGGLNLLREGHFSCLTTAQGLVSNSVWALHEDSDGYLWIGADHGLSRYKDGQFVNFTTRNGLPENLVNQILEDDSGCLWIGCRRGIYRVSRSSLDAIARGKSAVADCTLFGESDGMLSSETNGQVQPAGCKSHDGKLWFPTTRGLVVIDPRHVRRNERPPPVWIEEFSAENTTPQIGPEQHAEVSLPPGSGHHVEIRYTANSLWAPERILFKYRLEGHDQSWIEARNRRVAYYTNLKPGHYRFQVTACNNHGIWNERGARLDFSLKPFPYQTWWFWTIGAVLLGSSFAGFAQWRFRAAAREQELRRQKDLTQERLKRHTALALERARIARDVHDDLGARLTQISLLGDLLEHQQHTPGQDPDKISKLAREAVQNLDEIVWALEPANDHVQELIPYLFAYVQDLLASTDIRLQLDYPDLPCGGQIASQTRHSFFLVFKEALNNILKHARATEISIQIRRHPGQLQLQLRDNGCGFVPRDATKLGNGLGNMRSRMEAIGGRFEIESSPGQGAVITLVLPLDPASAP